MAYNPPQVVFRNKLQYERGSTMEIAISMEKVNVSVRDIKSQIPLESTDVYLQHDDIEAVYHDLFDDALHTYNKVNQDRHISNYYEHMLEHNLERTQEGFHIHVKAPADVLFTKDEQDRILSAFRTWLDEFSQRNTQLVVYKAIARTSASRMTLKLYIVGFATGFKRHLHTQPSFTRALAQQKTVFNLDEPYTEWRVNELMKLSKLLVQVDMNYRPTKAQLSYYNKYYGEPVWS